MAVAADVQQARDTAAQVFQMYGALPSYRAMLDREGVEGPADIAVVGDEAAVGARLDELAALGVTDFMGALYPTGPDPRATVERGWTFLATRAQRAAT